MSLFGTCAPGDAALANTQSPLFDDDDVAKTPPVATKPPSDSLFADDDFVEDDFSTDRPPSWNTPIPRKHQPRTDVVRNLLPATNVPDSYIDAFDRAMSKDSIGGRVSAAGVARTLNAANLHGDDQARVMGIVAPLGASTLGRGEFNVLLALIALAQRGEHISLDSVDERRRSKCGSLLYFFFLSFFFQSPLSPSSVFSGRVEYAGAHVLYVCMVFVQSMCVHMCDWQWHCAFNVVMLW